MKDKARDDRRRQIEQAAYDLLAENGYNGFSMLSIAKRAKASNETLYRWYGDKQGLFRTMVTRNAEEVRRLLEADIAKRRPARKTLEALAPLLLGLLVGPNAVALNRAAAADASGELGAAIAEAGRGTVFPLIARLFDQVQQDGVFQRTEPGDAAELFVTLLVGDLQIRRVIGALPEMTESEISARSKQALNQLYKLLDMDWSAVS